MKAKNNSSMMTEICGIELEGEQQLSHTSAAFTPQTKTVLQNDAIKKNGLH
jgi:hypothetical protein